MLGCLNPEEMRAFAQECKQPIEVLRLSNTPAVKRCEDFDRRMRQSKRSDAPSSGFRCELIMRKAAKNTSILLCLLVLSQVNGLAQSEEKKSPKDQSPLIWTDPGDISSRDLFSGAGGEKGVPHPPVTFEKEDTKGTNPKFDVRDQESEKWKVKLGVEARPETAATRLLWAVGYFTEYDYLLPELQVKNLPPHLQRGQNLVNAGGIVKDARLKRHPQHAEKEDAWRWKKNPFTSTRELNGLRVMMSLMNNWDVKDENNSVYKDDRTGREMYMVTDVGATFGSIGYRLGPGRGKGSLDLYRKSKFISHVHKGTVDFTSPAHSTVIGLLGIFSIPNFVNRMHLRWIGRNIPIEDAKWIGGLLAQLKPEQIQDAFRGAGYSDKDVMTYSEVVEKRIAELGRL